MDKQGTDSAPSNENTQLTPEVLSHVNDAGHGSFCNDLMVKLAGGFIIGSVFSLFFFRRRSFPIVFGCGFGTGMAVKNKDIYNSNH